MFIENSQWALYGGQADGYFEDIDYITMFADYRVPQVLVHFGAMTYDDHLMQLLKDGKIRQFLSVKTIKILCFHSIG